MTRRATRPGGYGSAVCASTRPAAMGRCFAWSSATALTRRSEWSTRSGYRTGSVGAWTGRSCTTSTRRPTASTPSTSTRLRARSRIAAPLSTWSTPAQTVWPSTPKASCGSRSQATARSDATHQLDGPKGCWSFPAAASRAAASAAKVSGTFSSPQQKIENRPPPNPLVGPSFAAGQDPPVSFPRGSASGREPRSASPPVAPGGDPSIHVDRLAGDEAGVIGRQEIRNFGHVHRLAKATQRRMCDHRLDTIGIGFHVRQRQRRTNETGRQRIHGAAGGSPLDSQGADRAIKCSLRAAIRDAQLLAMNPGDRRGHQAAPAGLLEQEGPEHLAGDKDAVVVRVDDVAQRGVVEIYGQAALVHARVRDQDVERIEGVTQALELRPITNVTDLGPERLQRHGRPAGDHHLGPGIVHRMRDRKPDAPVSAGDQRLLPYQASAHRSSPSRPASRSRVACAAAVARSFTVPSEPPGTSSATARPFGRARR